MPDHRYILGIDLGTTSLKGVLFTVDGELVAHHATHYPTTRHGDGRVEQDALDWLTAFWTVIDQLMAGRQLHDIVALGICGQVNTYVFVDADGQPLAPAIVWQDGRAADEAVRLDGMVSDEQRQQWWASGMAVSASHILPNMAHMASTRPDIWLRTDKVLSPKDFLLRHLTGQWTADPLAAFDHVNYSGRYIDALVALVPGAAHRLAPLSSYRSVVGRLAHPRLPGCTALVVNGTMDAFGCLFGSGASAPGEGSYISGTSEIIALIGDKPGGAAGIVSFAPVDDWYVQAGPTQSGGDTLRWLTHILGATHREVLDQAGQADRTGPGNRLLFLPHLEGERAPFWDPDARGSFLGLTSKDSAPELALAALEGVALSAALIFDGASDAIGHKPAALYIGGTGNSSDLWAQIRSDILEIPLHRVECLDTGSVGAAIMASVGAGLHASVAEASRTFVRVERSFLPDASRFSRYRQMKQRYLIAYEVLKPVYYST